MAAKSKALNADCFDPKTWETVNSLIKAISTAHKKIADLTDSIDLYKKDLKVHGESIFWKELGVTVDKTTAPYQYMVNGTVPNVYGNLECDAGKHRISITGTVKSGVVEEVDGQPSLTALPKMFEDTVPKLFNTVYTVTATPEQQSAQFYNGHPELFQLILKDDVKPETLQEIKRAFPKAFDLEVADSNAYATVYPDLVLKEFQVKNGFLENFGKLADEIRQKAKSFFVGYIQKTLNFNVVVGPTAKK